jgi:hypothetical protein
MIENLKTLKCVSTIITGTPGHIYLTMISKVNLRYFGVIRSVLIGNGMKRMVIGRAWMSCNSKVPPTVPPIDNRKQDVNAVQNEKDGNTEVKKDDENNDIDAEVQPEWLAMERRVKSHAPKPKGSRLPINTIDDKSANL